MSETGGLPRRLAGFSDLRVSPSGKAVFFRLYMQDGDSLTAGCAPQGCGLARGSPDKSSPAGRLKEHHLAAGSG
jgi:hypothetical protein